METITIDRGRDAGLSPYNQARVAYGLDPVSNFTQINPNLPQIVRKSCFKQIITIILILLQQFAVKGVWQSHKIDFQVIDRLRQVYNDRLDLVELYVGGMFESNNDMVGELFQAIILEQFTRTRGSDRFWFENTENGYDVKPLTFQTKI